jgi:hypothetical protein
MWQSLEGFFKEGFFKRESEPALYLHCRILEKTKLAHIAVDVLYGTRHDRKDGWTFYGSSLTKLFDENPSNDALCVMTGKLLIDTKLDSWLGWTNPIRWNMV